MIALLLLLTSQVVKPDPLTEGARKLMEALRVVGETHPGYSWVCTAVEEHVYCCPLPYQVKQDPRFEWICEIPGIPAKHKDPVVLQRFSGDSS